MIRLRHRDGQSEQLPDSCAMVEICDDEGRVAAVVHRRLDGSVVVYEKGDEELERYCDSLNIKEAKIVKLKN